MSNVNQVPDESKQLIDSICQVHSQDPTKVEREYWKLFNQGFLNKMYKNTPSDLKARHDWTKDMLQADYKTKRPTDERTIIPFGKGGISSFPNQEPSARLWIVDMTSKKKAVLNLDYELLKNGFLDNVIPFNQYVGMLLVPQSDGWMGVDERVFPIPDATPVGGDPSKFFEKIKIQTVTTKQLGDPKFRTRTTTDGKYVYADIKCIRDVTIAKSNKTPAKYEDFEFIRGTVAFADKSNDGYTTNDGIEIPSSLFSFCHPDFCYPKYTRGDAYGVIRIDTKKALRFDLCNFIPTGPIPDHS